ncbi:LysR substrate-binding domain-containing protein, partial [Pseudomonas viridiflava]|uniref:LysR substrate-binding domain-containing protein n=1 Tax=Pseudomonas viridiflava TaxID=33069 RepID=UPI00311A9DB8
MFAGSEAPLRGRLRVDLPTELARTTLMQALPSFMSRHPEVQLEISSTGVSIWCWKGWTVRCVWGTSSTRHWLRGGWVSCAWSMWQTLPICNAMACLTR